MEKSRWGYGNVSQFAVRLQRINEMLSNRELLLRFKESRPQKHFQHLLYFKANAFIIIGKSTTSFKMSWARWRGSCFEFVMGAYKLPRH